MSYFYLRDEKGIIATDRHGDPKVNVPKVAVHGGIAFVSVIALIMGGCPVYNVWQQDLEGQAELARAEQNRQIAIEEAKAAEQSAKSYANAEVIRAEGVAEANRIIADGLGGPDGYLRYLWIQNLPNGRTVYIPTEAGMPITEAGREEVIGVEN